MARPSAYPFYFIGWILLVVLAFFALPYLRVPILSLIGWRIFVALNFASFALFAIDKLQAQGNGLRVPERQLYLATLMGGSIGTLVSMWLFRHKTRKVGFQVVIALLVLIHVLIFLRWQHYV